MFLDEMYPALVAAMVRRAGVDMISAHECGREGMTDHGILLLAAREGRCVVTENHGDFLRLTGVFYEQHLPHAGVILIPSHVGHHRYGLLAAALVRFAQEHPDGLQPYEIRWLNVRDT